MPQPRLPRPTRTTRADPENYSRDPPVPRAQFEFPFPSVPGKKSTAPTRGWQNRPPILAASPRLLFPAYASAPQNSVWLRLTCRPQMR